MRYTFALLALVAGTSANPIILPRQGITAAITPSGTAPPGCQPTYSGTFGIAVMTIGTKTPAKRPVSKITDGQPQAPTARPISQISDGQPQVVTGAPVSQISDGQPQAATKTMAPVTQITDGQVEAPTAAPISQIGDGQIQAPTGAPVSQITDGQVQGPTGAPVSQISDDQPQGPRSTAAPVTQISDAQPQAPTATAPAVSQISDAQPQAPLTAGAPAATGSAAPGSAMVGCQTNTTLALTLSRGILLDGQGRTGYIAANYQFQFDKPAQTGAIYTAGFSVCSNGSLALGGSSVFYRCLSGSFYNLYNENWAPQCEPVTINVLTLINCA